jgi:hypothetical protein
MAGQGERTVENHGIPVRLAITPIWHALCLSHGVDVCEFWLVEVDGESGEPVADGDLPGFRLS